MDPPVGVGQGRRDQAGGEIAEPPIQVARDRRRADRRRDGEAREDRPETIAPPVDPHQLATRKAAITAIGSTSHHHDRVRIGATSNACTGPNGPSVPSALTMAMRTP